MTDPGFKENERAYYLFKTSKRQEQEMHLPVTVVKVYTKAYELLFSNGHTKLVPKGSKNLRKIQ